MRVLCQSASGRQVWVNCPHATTDQQACNEALARLSVEQPGQGWRTVVVL